LEAHFEAEVGRRGPHYNLVVPTAEKFGEGNGAVIAKFGIHCK